MRCHAAALSTAWCSAAAMPWHCLLQRAPTAGRLFLCMHGTLAMPDSQTVRKMGHSSPVRQLERPKLGSGGSDPRVSACARRWAKGLVFLAFGFWVPQIAYCARHDARQPLRPLYVAGMSLTRLALPLYLFGCPRNLLRVAHAPGVCAGLCAWVGLQVWHILRSSPLCLIQLFVVLSACLRCPCTCMRMPP